MVLLKKRLQQSNSTSQINLSDQAQKICAVIDSCISIEQLDLTEKWVDKIWKDEELIFFVKMRILGKEREFAKAAQEKILVGNKLGTNTHVMQ